MKFAWDRDKNLANERNHGVSFQEASALFRSGVYIAIGPIRRGIVLVVWTERDESTIRIISARWATKGELALYRAHIERSR